MNYSSLITNHEDDPTEVGLVLEELYCRYQLDFGLVKLDYINLSKTELDILSQKVNQFKRKSDFLLYREDYTLIILPMTIGEELDSFVLRLKVWLSNFLIKQDQFTFELKISSSDSVKGFGNFSEVLKNACQKEILFSRKFNA